MQIFLAHYLYVREAPSAGHGPSTVDFNLDVGGKKIESMFEVNLRSCHGHSHANHMWILDRSPFYLVRRTTLRSKDVLLSFGLKHILPLTRGSGCWVFQQFPD